MWIIDSGIFGETSERFKHKGPLPLRSTNELVIYPGSHINTSTCHISTRLAKPTMIFLGCILSARAMAGRKSKHRWGTMFYLFTQTLSQGWCLYCIVGAKSFPFDSMFVSERPIGNWFPTLWITFSLYWYLVMYFLHLFQSQLWINSG